MYAALAHTGMGSYGAVLDQVGWWECFVVTNGHSMLDTGREDPLILS